MSWADRSNIQMAARTMTNAAMLLIMASSFNFTNQLVLPNEETNLKYQSVLKAIKDRTEIQNGIKYDDKTPNRVKYDIDELEDIEAAENAEKDTARRKAILESNFKNDYNIPSTVLIADRDISIYKYNKDANTDEENNKLKREGSLTFNADISGLIKNQPRTANKRRNSAISAADRVENNNFVYVLDVNEKAKNYNAKDIPTLKMNRFDNAILRSNTVETKTSTGRGFSIANTESTKNSDSINFRFETPKGIEVDTSKHRLKRDSEYDDDLNIWDDCVGKEHLAYIDGDFKCVEISMENRILEALANCPAGSRRVFIQQKLILCLPRKKRRV